MMTWYYHCPSTYRYVFSPFKNALLTATIHSMMTIPGATGILIH